MIRMGIKLAIGWKIGKTIVDIADHVLGRSLDKFTKYLKKKYPGACKISEEIINTATSKDATNEKIIGFRLNS